jgi:hypothetical protein
MGGRMKRLVLMFLVIGISISILVAYWISLPNYDRPDAKVDTSWIPSVVQYLEEAKPYPPDLEYPSRDAYMVYLYDNGTSQFVVASNTDKIVSHLKSLLLQVNVRRNDSIPDEFFFRVRNSDKVVRLWHPFWEDYPLWEKFQSAYFVLEDPLNEGLAGSIIIRQNIAGKYGGDQLSIWAIAK